MTEVALIEESAQKSRSWLDDLARELGRPGDHKYALRVLRGFLHTLRDRLPVVETAHFAAQLPVLIRGVYYEGWQPESVPRRYHDLETFLEHLAGEAFLAGETESAYAAEATARLLHHKIDEHEIRKVAAVMPPEIATVITDADAGAGHGTR